MAGQCVKSKPQGGFRQDNPLSPFLFTRVVESFSQSINLSRDKMFLQGFKIGREEVDVSHIQFVDISMIL